MSKPIYRMSNAGTCPRALSAEKLGYIPKPAPAWLMQTAEEGKEHEKRIKKELAEAKCEIRDEQLEVSLDYPALTMLGHLDGKIKLSKELFKDKRFEVFLVDVNPNEIDYSIFSHLEIKSMSYFRFQKWENEGFSGFPDYAAQETCYWEATGSKLSIYIIKDRSGGRRYVYILGKKPIALSSIMERIYTANSFVLKKELVPKEFDSDSIECRQCFYKHLCTNPLEKLSEATNTELLKVTTKLRKGRALIKEGKQLETESQARLKEHLTALNVNRFLFNNFAIKKISVKETTMYPKHKLLEIFGEEELEPASEIRQGYDYIKATDLEEEQE